MLQQEWAAAAFADVADVAGVAGDADDAGACGVGGEHSLTEEGCCFLTRTIYHEAKFLSMESCVMQFQRSVVKL